MEVSTLRLSWCDNLVFVLGSSFNFWFFGIFFPIILELFKVPFDPLPSVGNGLSDQVLGLFILDDDVFQLNAVLSSRLWAGRRHFHGGLARSCTCG